MAHHGLIVADAARARFFTADVRLDQLDEVYDLIHPQAQMSGAETHTDGHGRNRGAPLDPHTDRKQHEERVFARQVGAEALELLSRGEQWIIVAAPSFLGELRRHMPKAVKDRVVAEISKDLSKLPAHELPDAIRRALPPTTGMP